MFIKAILVVFLLKKANHIEIFSLFLFGFLKFTHEVFITTDILINIR